MSDTNKLDRLRKQYFKSVLVTETEEELMSILPTPVFSNFFELMKGIIDSLLKEIRDYEQFAEEDIESRKYWLAERNKLQAKLKYCENVLRQGYVTASDTVEEVDNSQKINIIFGINPSGNVAFFNDLRKDIDKHYYPAILEMLDALENNSLRNIERFNSSNSKLQGLFKAKAYQIRIIFRQLPDNMIYVDMVRVKKDDWSLKDSQMPSKRCMLLNSDFEKVKRRVKKKDRVEDLIIDSQKVLAEIREYIEKNTLGRKK